MKPIRIPVTPGENGIPINYPLRHQFDMAQIDANFKDLEEKIATQERDIQILKYVLDRTIVLIEEMEIQHAAN